MKHSPLSLANIFLIVGSTVSLVANAVLTARINFFAGFLIACFLPLYMIVAFHVRKRSRQAKSDANERLPFTLLVQNSDDIVAMSTTEGKISFANKAGREKLGLALEGEIGDVDRMKMYAPHDRQIMATEIMPALRTHGSWSGEVSYVNQKTGELIPTIANFIRLTDPDTGESLGIAVVARDIRDRRRLEKAIDRFFDVSLDMLAIASIDGYFLKLNPSFSKILGYSTEELLARPTTDFIHPDDIEATKQQLQNQRDGQPVLAFENRFRTKAGDYRWFSWKSYPDGDVTYGAARDITEEKKHKFEVEELSRKAIAASKAKSEFLANMSHEIRTPINGVVGMTSLLLDTNLSDQQLDYAQNIKTSSESLLTVINDILDFSKVEAGKLDFENVDFNFENLIDDTAKSLSWVVRNKSLPFIVDIERGFTTLFVGDPGRIRQILNNLLSNAVKFTQTGAIKLEVKINARTPTHTTFHFAVHDTGIGLTDQEQNRLFQAFSQADASTARKYGGTGLGLSISKHLVELMGGEIGVISKKGEGSTFWFKLTLEHSRNSIETARPKAVAQKTKFPNAQLLVAEDNFVNQKILLAMLEKMGFKAQAVANGNEVLSVLKDRSFDLILMDCQMPELDGYEATKRIRASTGAYAHIPVVALTANALKGDREICLEAGMDDYASKPVSAGELSQVIERWLEAAALRKRSA